MIKYLGAVGSFVRLNDDTDQTYNFMTVFSSSAATNVLFTASVNNFTGSVTISTSSTSLYINGVPSTVLPNQEWAHLTVSFDNKLITSDENNFIIRFGDYNYSNFNVQNLYIMESSLSSSAVGYLHKEFTGAGSQVVRVNDSASYSINFIDAIETNYTSASITSVYQPLKGQLRFDKNVAAVTDSSLAKFISASTMINDDLYIDGYGIEQGDFVLSIYDKLIYQLTASSNLIPISSSIGDFIKVLFGRENAGSYWQYSQVESEGEKTLLIVGSDIYSGSAIVSNDQTTWTQSSVPFSDWSSANIYQSGSFVLISSTGSVAVSTDGMTWTASYINAGYLGSNYFKGIAYGNGVFVTALSNGDYFYVSNNGLHWYSSSYIGMTGTWSKVGYGNGVFMAVSGDYYNDNEVVISTDGINWTLLGDPPAIGKTWNRPVYGDNKWLLIRASDTFGDQSFYTSSNNGLTWTSHSYPHYFPYNNYIDPVYGNGVFIIASNANRFTDFVYYSSNGINWQTASVGTTGTWQDINYNLNGFTLLSSYYGMQEGILVTSTNGMNWSSSIALPAYSWYGIAGDNQKVVYPGFERTPARLKVDSYQVVSDTNNL